MVFFFVFASKLLVKRKRISGVKQKSDSQISVEIKPEKKNSLVVRPYEIGSFSDFCRNIIKMK